MVTHNPELADKYSDRIIRMVDGKILEDTKPITPHEKPPKRGRPKKMYGKKQSSMSFLTALRLSGKNLLSKKRRTTITSFAASITPRPSIGCVCMVISPINKSVFCIKVVKHIAIICLHHPVKPSVYPLGRLNM